MWSSPFLAVVLMTVGVPAIPTPGLLRVPKVYNAVITSNQNLAPSRAYPVIQPVVHRTAIGYVPPFYYTQLSPGYPGPEFLPLGPGVPVNRPRDQRPDEGQRPEAPPPRPEEVESVETTDGTSSPDSPPPKKISRPTSGRKNDDSSSEELSSAESSERSSTTNNDDPRKRVKNERQPLNFYPNYQSLYYDPYYYPYNAFPPHLAAPGTYYVDYPQPPGILGPLPPPLPPPLVPAPYPVPDARPEAPSGGSDAESARRDGKQKIRTSEKREKIPDVPPPPLPTSMRKKTS